ncbi:MAG: 5'-nucleotidase C-terminal domain-containing protein [Actinomycetota bacterium]
MRKVGIILAAASLAVAISAPTTSADKGGRRPDIDIQILNVSDWHAQLDPVSGVGGAAVLSAYWKADRLANPNSITLTAGDAYGASPPLSNFFNEVPAVQAMNAMGFSADGLGNHNFDRGIGHLQQMIDTADFPYLSANLDNVDDNVDGVEPYEIFDFGRVQVAVIAVTNPDAPTLVFPGSFGTIEVTDPAEAVREARKEAHSEGADVFIVMAHMGITFIDGNGDPQGPLVDLVKSLKTKDYALVLGDHTDFPFNGVINGLPVMENASKGTTYGRVKITVDQNNRKVRGVIVEQVVPLAAAVTPDPAVVAVLQPYRDALGPILNAQVGSATRVIPRTDACGNSAGRTCESLVGNVVADAMRTRNGTDFAITNAGGLRASLTCPTVDAAGDFCPAYTPPPFVITAGQVLTVLPFGNESVTLTIDGAELKTYLENGVSAMPAVNGRYAQVSGLCFTYDISAAPGSRVVGAVRQAADGSCTGAAIDLTAASSYTLATNDFMAAGGDGYPVVTSRTTTRAVMDQDLAGYVTANSPISPAIQGRSACVTTGATACPIVTP